MTEPQKQRKPGKWVVLKSSTRTEDGVWHYCTDAVALSAKAAIEQQNPAASDHIYVAIPERNWRPYTAEIPPTPPAVLRVVKSE